MPTTSPPPSSAPRSTSPRRARTGSSSDTTPSRLEQPTSARSPVAWLRLESPRSRSAASPPNQPSAARGLVPGHRSRHAHHALDPRRPYRRPRHARAWSLQCGDGRRAGWHPSRSRHPPRPGPRPRGLPQG
uniref:Uncharacterized protein n=1 Tax=uncultured marine virus TaxID=186617 RepID=A0A0F7L9Q8_9VIRU|nr:hypothetical protein [uncultured marine virus]